MARVNSSFRPAGDSDDEDSDEDDFILDYRAKKQSPKTLDPRESNIRTDETLQKQNICHDKKDFMSPHRPQLGKSVLPLDDLRHAATKGDKDAIKRCLSQGIAPDHQLTTGWTALMYAGINAKYDAMSLLIENGADVNYHCNHYSVLMATCGNAKNVENQVVECVQLLIEKKADVNTFDRHHMNALMYAARAGRPNVVRRLLDAGANKNQQDSRGYTALHWACCKGHIMVVQVLMEAGADKLLKTSDGSLPRDIAYVSGKERICQILQRDESGQTTFVASGDAITMNGHILHNRYEDPNSLLQVVGPSSKICTYGDLEVYLSGLELSQYIEVFQQNEVTFQAFLRMTDQDLQQLGIRPMAHRKKILDSIHATHKREWQPSSLPSVQYNKQLKCLDAIDIISNINKHTSYISSTIGYITDQIKAHPEILRSGQDGSSIEDLLARSRHGFTNVSNLYHDLSELHSYLNEISGMENFDPPELIRKTPKHLHFTFRPKNVLISLTGILTVVLVWKNRVSVIKLFSKQY